MSAPLRFYSIRQLLPSIIFPVVCFGSIYSDWNHTRKWKQQERLNMERLERLRSEELEKNWERN